MGRSKLDTLHQASTACMLIGIVGLALRKSWGLEMVIVCSSSLVYLRTQLIC